MTRRSLVLTLAVTLGACAGDSGTPAPSMRRHYELGRAATPQEVAALDADVGPDGAGLPAGSGTAVQGEALFTTKCAVCHGAKGQGTPPLYPAIIGRNPTEEGFRFGADPKLNRTIGNYWPYATTVFDYVRRAMPHPAPGSLTNDEVYALTAYLLAANQVIPMTTSLDAAALKAVKMPYVSKFVPDNRRGGREVR